MPSGTLSGTSCSNGKTCSSISEMSSISSPMNLAITSTTSRATVVPSSPFAGDYTSGRDVSLAVGNRQASAMPVGARACTATRPSPAAGQILPIPAFKKTPYRSRFIEMFDEESPVANPDSLGAIAQDTESRIAAFTNRQIRSERQSCGAAPSLRISAASSTSLQGSDAPSVARQCAGAHSEEQVEWLERVRRAREQALQRSSSSLGRPLSPRDQSTATIYYSAPSFSQRDQSTATIYQSAPSFSALCQTL